MTVTIHGDESDKMIHPVGECDQDEFGFRRRIGSGGPALVDLITFMFGLWTSYNIDPVLSSEIDRLPSFDGI